MKACALREEVNRRKVKGDKGDYIIEYKVFGPLLKSESRARRTRSKKSSDIRDLVLIKCTDLNSDG